MPYPSVPRFVVAAYNLRQLKYFITTVDCGSVAEASRKLYIAQPAISTAIKGLEDSFGVQLLIRHHAQGVYAKNDRDFGRYRKIRRGTQVAEGAALLKL